MLQSVPWRGSQGLDEPLDLIASLRKVYRGVSNGVLFGVPQAVDRSEVLSGLGVRPAGAPEGGAVLPNGRQSAPKFGECGLLVGLICSGEAGRIDGVGQRQRAGRAIEWRRLDVRSPHLKTDLHRADDGEPRHEEGENRDSERPSQLGWAG